MGLDIRCREGKALYDAWGLRWLVAFTDAMLVYERLATPYVGR